MDGYSGSATMKWLALVVSILLSSTDGWSADLTGQVVSVLDGDTIAVLHSNRAGA